MYVQFCDPYGIMGPSVFREKIQNTILHQFEEPLIIRWRTILYITKDRERETLLNTLWLNNETLKCVLYLHWDYFYFRTISFSLQGRRMVSMTRNISTIFLSPNIISFTIQRFYELWDLGNHLDMLHDFTDGDNETQRGWLALKGCKRKSRGLTLDLAVPKPVVFLYFLRHKEQC